MRCYLAHPVTDYGTQRQADAVALLEARGFCVENPDQPKHQDGYRVQGMSYFTDLVQGCGALAFLRFTGGAIGAGVAKEVQTALNLRLPVYDVTDGRFEDFLGFALQRVLSVEQTRSKINGNGRVLAAFSCGEASAVTAKKAIELHGDRVEVYYCDTFAYEHPDNRRFFDDVQKWLGREIKVLRSEDYTDIYDVFERTRWLVGVGGARCTTELKKNVRKAYQRPDDLHVFGFTVEERRRIDGFFRENPDLFAEFPLWEQGITKSECRKIIREAGIEVPAMYRLGYKNNNCIGCVKGGSGYWNKIRRDFPEAFARMAGIERQLDAAICKKEGKTDGKRWRKEVFLDELPPDAGRYDAEPDIECGVLCIHEPEPTSPL